MPDSRQGLPYRHLLDAGWFGDRQEVSVIAMGSAAAPSAAFMVVISIPAYTLNDGTGFPAIGRGTWPMSDTEAEGAVAEGLRLGE